MSWCWLALVEHPADGARIVDALGPAAWVSLVLPPVGVRLPFDDLAVQQARRAVLAGPPQEAVSTLLSDASHFEGAITVARGGGVERLADDPFARVFPARILSVGAGLFGAVRHRAGRRSSATAAPSRGPGTGTARARAPGAVGAQQPGRTYRATRSQIQP